MSAINVEAHLPLVKHIAACMARRLPHRIELDDLIQDGVVGLLQAAQRFTEGHGASFATFAGHRVRGAMLDRIRSSFTRSQAVRAVQGDRPLYEQWTMADADSRPHDVPVDAITSAWLRRQVEALPARERLVVEAVYFDGLTEKDTAPIAGLSETGVNYVRRQALKRLRGAA